MKRLSLKNSLCFLARHLVDTPQSLWINYRKIISWALYDWANSGFATTVMAGFFPLFFKQFYCAGADAAHSTARLGWTVSSASLLVALMAPVAGVIADTGSCRKGFLLFFTIVGITATGAMALPSHGQWILAAVLYLIAVVGFSSGNIFYDALLPAVAPPEARDIVSSFGFALGYLGGGILLAVNVAMTLKPSMWGISSPESAVRLSFISVALWWLLFSIPLFLSGPEETFSKPLPAGKLLARSFSRLRQTFRKIHTLRTLFLFLLAYWFYIDGVSSVIRMAVDYGLSIGLGTQGLISALLLVQFVGFPATLLMGRVAERFGARRTIMWAIGAYMAVVLWASGMEKTWEFYLLAAIIGMVQGGIQAMSRSIFSCMIPEGAEAEFFGFYNIVGRSAAVMGPAMMGTITLWTGSARTGILALIPLFAAGGILLEFSGKSRVDTADMV